jgi:hypothetical protein
VGTHDRSRVRLYVNGVLEGELAIALTVEYGSRPIFLGTSGETVFNGKLNSVVDEASIYNRAVDPSEVAALHAAGAAGKRFSATGLITSLAQFVQSLKKTPTSAGGAASDIGAADSDGHQLSVTERSKTQGRSPGPAPGRAVSF